MIMTGGRRTMANSKLKRVDINALLDKDVNEMSLRDISEMWSGVIGAPLLYHDFVPYEILSVVVGPMITVKGAPIKRPNLYTLKISPPGIGLKSTVLGAELSVVERFEYVKWTGLGSPEGLIDFVIDEQGNSILIFEEEFSKTMGDKKDYRAGFDKILIALHDGIGGKFSYSKAGLIVRREIPPGQYVCCWASDHPQFYDRRFWGGGLGRRMIGLVAYENDNWQPYIREDDARERIILKTQRWVRVISERVEDGVVIRFSPNAATVINAINKEVTGGGGYYFISATDFIAKIAVFNAVARGSMEVEKRDVLRADWLIQRAGNSFRPIIEGGEDFYAVLGKVARYLVEVRPGEWIPIRDVYKNLKKPAKTVKEAVNKLSKIKVKGDRVGYNVEE